MAMKLVLPLLLTVAAYGTAAGAATMDELEQRAKVVATSGSVAAGFVEVTKGDVSPAELEQRFAQFGDEALAAARKWAKDDELVDAPPAFRRFLYFEYLTKGTDISAAASNPEHLLINMDSAVDNILTVPAIASAAKRHMEAQVDEPQFDVIGDQLLATFPMVPPPEKAARCVACHASAEVNRPYPTGTRVLGYTFVVQPL